MAERKRQPQARDKLTFLLSLVPYLIDHDRVSVLDVARTFDVSAEEVRSAVRLIAMSGIPGDTGAYQHDDLFDIAWDAFEENDEIVLTHLVAIDDAPRFSGRETAALIAGVQYLSALPETRDSHALTSLLAKLARGSSSAPQAVAVESTQTDAALALIREGVARGVQVEFDYRGAEGSRERRRVDPARIESIDSDWYLRGWCHLRHAVRTFRLDRISELVVTDEPSTGAAQQAQIPDNLFEGSADDIVVTLDVVPAALSLIQDYLPPAASVVPVGALSRVSIRVSHFHGLKRLVAGLPALVTVVEPAEARRAVAEWASAGAEGYADSTQ